MTDTTNNDIHFFGLLDRICNAADNLVMSNGAMDRVDFLFDDDDWRMFLANQWIVNSWIEHIKAHYLEYRYDISCSWLESSRQLRFTVRYYIQEMETPDAEDWWAEMEARLSHLHPRIIAVDEDTPMAGYDASHSCCPIPPSTQASG